jgi:hypothetical protein
LLDAMITKEGDACMASIRSFTSGHIPQSDAPSQHWASGSPEIVQDVEEAISTTPEGQDLHTEMAIELPIYQATLVSARALLTTWLSLKASISTTDKFFRLNAYVRTQLKAAGLEPGSVSCTIINGDRVHSYPCSENGTAIEVSSSKLRRDSGTK